jgi:hypothetical protein
VLVALIAVAAFLLIRSGRPQDTGAGTPAPTFSAATADGSRKVSFPADLKGHWVWLMFSGLT